MKLSFEQKAKLKLEPKIIISQLQIQVLLSPVEELEVMIEKEKEENPFLEVSGYDEQEGNFEEEPERKVSSEELTENEYLSDSTDDLSYFSDFVSRYEVTDEEEKSKRDNIYVDYGSFYQSVIEQIYSHFEDEKERIIAFEIFHSIDSKGYLTKNVSEIADELRKIGLDVSDDDVEEVRREFMQLEPVGMGSKDTSEYLSFFLQKLISEKYDKPFDFINDVKKEYPEIFELFEKLGSAADKSREIILRKISEGNETLAKIIELVKDKDIPPFPTFGINSNEHFVFRKSPDIEVEVYEDQIHIYINSPRVYTRDIRKEDWYKGIKLDDTSKKIIQEKIRRATEIERGIKMRNDIIYKVSNCIFSYQKDFLRTGNKKDIKPLTLENLSELCNLSVSMISRAIKDKYVKTPFGIFALKEFLSHGIAGKNTDKKMSQKTILEEIKNMILNEDKTNPLSDGDIVKLIKEKFGIEIARRTVVKYRKKLGISNIEDRKSMYQKLFTKSQNI